MRAGAVLLLYVMCSDKGFACISTPQSQGDPAWMVPGPSHNKDRSETAAQRALGSGQSAPLLTAGGTGRAERRHYYNLLMKTQGTLPSVCLGRS